MSVYLKCKADGGKFSYKGKTSADKPYLAMNYTTQTGSESSQTTMSKAYIPLTTNTQLVGPKKVIFNVSGSKMYIQGVETRTTTIASTTKDIIDKTVNIIGGAGLDYHMMTSFDYVYAGDITSSLVTTSESSGVCLSTINFTSKQYVPKVIINNDITADTNYTSIDLDKYSFTAVKRNIYLSKITSNSSSERAIFLLGGETISNRQGILNFIEDYSLSNAYYRQVNLNGRFIVHNMSSYMSYIYTNTSYDQIDFGHGSFTVDRHYVDPINTTSTISSTTADYNCYYERISSTDNPHSTKSVVLFTVSPDYKFGFFRNKKTESWHTVYGTHTIHGYIKTIPSPKVSNCEEYYNINTYSFIMNGKFIYGPTYDTTITTTTQI